MNLHINVIRGCCVHGYFQQRGWEDVKHAKPLCIYANWAPFSNLNMNLAEMNLFTSSLLRDPTVFLHVHTSCTAAYTSSVHLCCAAGWDLRLMGASWDMRNCGFPMIWLFENVLSWHSKYCNNFWQRGSEASGACDFCADAKIRFWSICQRGYPVTNHKGLSHSLQEYLWILYRPFNLHYIALPPLSLFWQLKPTVSHGETCTCLSHLVSNVNIFLYEFPFCISAQTTARFSLFNTNRDGIFNQRILQKNKQNESLWDWI